LTRKKNQDEEKTNRNRGDTNVRPSQKRARGYWSLL